MKNERVKTLPATELDHILSTEIFIKNKRRKHEQVRKPAKFPILNAELSRMKRSVELLSRETTRIDFQTAPSCVGSWYKLMFE